MSWRVLVLFLIFSQGVPFVRAEGLLRICSAYRDEARIASSEAAFEEFCGSGLVFTGGFGVDRLLLITSSHVSQGTRLQISADALGQNRVLGVRGRLVDATHDLELFELDPKAAAPLANFDMESGRIVFIPRALEKWKSSAMVVEQGSASENAAFVLKTPWSQPGASGFRVDLSDIVFNYRFRARSRDPNRLAYLPITNELYAPAKITPGMSGSPLIQGGILRGVATRMSRDFFGSWFASEQEVESLIRKYLAGRRGRVDETTWHLWSGILYRDFGAGTAEIDASSVVVGGQTRGDGGNQTRGDGGGPVTAESDALKAEAALSKLESGIRFRGHSVIGFRVPGLGAVFGDTDVLDLLARPQMSRNLNPFDVGSVAALPPSTDFGKLLARKVRGGIVDFNSNNIKNILALELGTCPELFLKSTTRSVYLGLSEVGLECESCPSIRLEDDTIHVQLKGPFPELEPIAFALDRQGRVVDSEGRALSRSFRPVVRIRGKSNTDYRVDLRRLFFIDLSTLGLTDGSQVDLWKFLLAAKKEGAVIAFRREDSPRTFEIQFQSYEELPEACSRPPKEIARSCRLPEDADAMPAWTIQVGEMIRAGRCGS